MSTEPLNVGDPAKLTYTVKVGGTLTDATVALTVTRPDGTTLTPTVNHDSLGTYSAVFTVDQPGIWKYTFTASGAATEVTDGQLIVRAPAAQDVYCTVGELRGQLGDTGTTPKLDEQLLRRAIAATARAIDHFCGRRFWADATPTVRLYRPRGRRVVITHDIATTTGLVVATDTTGSGSYSTVWDPADYQLEPLDAAAAGRPWWKLTAIGVHAFPTHPFRATLQVTARFGRLALPDDVNQAAILKAAKVFKRRESPDGFATGMADFGPVRISRFEDPDVVSFLAPYMRYSTPDI